MTSSECRYYNGVEKEDGTGELGCNAPICPRDGKSVLNCVWFPDEEVCRRGSVPDWVRTQRKLVEKHANTERCWTVRMLETLSAVYEGAEGIDPDREPREAEAAWLKLHKKREPRVLSEKERNVLRERINAARKNLGRSGIRDGESDEGESDRGKRENLANTHVVPENGARGGVVV